MTDEILQHGYTFIRQFLSPAEVNILAEQLGSPASAGQRGMLSHPAVRQFAFSESVLAAIRPFIDGEPRPVRAIYFDKSPHTNWLVTWHQDLTIAVTSQIEVPGFGPWSNKEGIVHVQPPVELLGQMLTFRLHLDETDEANGALKILSGSHLHGRLSPTQIEQFRTQSTEKVCTANSGDVLLMKPLLLHASGRSTSTRHRRILHIEYAGFDLPNPLCWNELA